ncbi:hypothetical protein [Algivirga pacifica]|uniref:Lipoprotein SmpA/OmlA domain-containing protein n=1 Tax=Algivirga pacifica TaxID=1162670 RepID=A0ABP9DDP8_9BACT
MKKILGVLGILLLLGSCGKKLEVTEQEFSSITWKNDTKACQGKRAEQQEKFENIRERILGVRKDQVLQLLGRPDKTDLAKRNTSYFIYYVSEGKQCEGSDKNEEGDYYRFKFSPLEIVMEISYHKGV